MAKVSAADMSARIVCIRAVNVGGTAKLPMADLREIAAALGAPDARTYIQSGNLVCTPPGDPGDFDRALETAIQKQFGFFREVMSRSVDELRAARADHPFEVIEPKFSYITLLAGAPTLEAIAQAQSLPCGDDRWQVIGRDLHVRYAAGAGQPQMPVNKILAALGTPGTARNLNSIDKLIEMAGARS